MFYLTFRYNGEIGDVIVGRIIEVCVCVDVCCMCVCGLLSACVCVASCLHVSGATEEMEGRHQLSSGLSATPLLHQPTRRGVGECVM